MTKDERFLLELYKACKDEKSTIDPLEVGHALGYTDHLIKTILKGLMQGNLIKRYSPQEIALTSRGLEVARSLA